MVTEHSVPTTIGLVPVLHEVSAFITFSFNMLSKIGINWLHCNPPRVPLIYSCIQQLSYCVTLFLPGVVYQSDDRGNCVDVLTAAGPVKALLYDEEKDLLVTVTINMMLYQHSVSADNVATAVAEVLGIDVCGLFAFGCEMVV